MDVVENGRYAVSESRRSIVRRLRYVKFTARHRDARQIQIANAQGRIEQAEVQLRALKHELSDLVHQDEQCIVEDERELRELLEEQEEFKQLAKVIDLDARAIGYKHLAPGFSASEIETI